MDSFGSILTEAPNVQIFTGKTAPGAVTAAQAFHVWRRPRNATMIDIFAVGAGGGGGLGHSASGSQHGGGGGGGSASLVRASFMAATLPEYLYIWTPLGGRGATSGNASGVGGFAIISVSPASIGTDFLLLQTGNGTAGAGSNGAASGSAAAGGGATVFSDSGPYPYLRTAIVFQAVAGTGGGNGGSAGAGNDPSNASLVITPGAGGGGGNAGDTAGGTIVSVPGLLPIPGASGSGGAGVGGYFQMNPFGAVGGGGGGGSAAGTGGKGCDAAYGCGGGGGGGGVTGGEGGRGGDSIIFITAR